ncbi:MAG: hypothetical protein K2J83_04950 [Clostridia bacterium]|nr:hypothetical protein [Clostridia bacterium]
MASLNMDANFKKIKKKFLIYSLIKSLICGVSAGLFAVGAILLALKLAGIPIHGGYYALIGVCVACACFGIVFPFLRPNDLAVARKLDKEYGLRERVETMVAFEKDGGDMARMQREDAQLKLGNLPKKKPDFKKLWQYILIPFLAIAVFVAALVVPDRYRDGGDDVYAITDWQLGSVKEIIENVQDSGLDDEVKQNTVAALDGFYNALVVGVPESAFEYLLLSTVGLIDGIITDGNTYFAICSKLITSEDYEELSFTIYESVLAYQGLIKYSSYDSVRTRASTLEADIDYLCRTYLIGGEESLLNHYKAITQEEGLINYLKEYKDGLNELLAGCGVDASDGLYDALSRFAINIANTSVQFEGYTDSYFYSMLQLNAFNPLAVSLPACLYTQSYNYLMDEYIRERLAVVFGYPSNNLPTVIPELKKPADPDAPPDNDDDNNGDNSGGLGDGDMKYGSDDIIYDPDKGYVSYGDVINEYYSRLLGQIIDGSIPEDIAGILTNYFDMLMSGIENKDDGNNNLE